MLRKIYYELMNIRKELQAIRTDMELQAAPKKYALLAEEAARVSLEGGAINVKAV